MKETTMHRSVFLALMLLTVGLLRGVAAQECSPAPLVTKDHYVEGITDDFFFAASSDQGAVGDVVAIDISLMAENPRQDLAGISVVGKFDNSRAELIGQPLYSEAFDRLSALSFFYHLVEGEGRGNQ